MEDKNELSDIVLEKDDDSQGVKLKRILVIAAVLVLLFLAVLIIMRALNKPASSQEARLVLPPEPKSVETKIDEPLFEQVPIIEEEEESFEDMVKKLKEKEIQRTKEQEKTLEEKQPEPKEIVSADKPVLEPKEVVVPKKEEAKPKEVAAPKSVEGKTAKGLYVQVLSTSKVSPSSSFLKTLKDKGYEYTLYDTVINNIPYTKVLIGPFEGSSAKENLAKIRKDVTDGAFMYEVK